MSNDKYTLAPENLVNAREGLPRAMASIMGSPLVTPPDAPLFGVAPDVVCGGQTAEEALAKVTDLTAFEPQFFNSAIRECFEGRSKKRRQGVSTAQET